MVKWNLNDICAENDYNEKMLEIEALVDDFCSKESLLTSDMDSSVFMDMLKEDEKMSIVSGELSVRTFLKTCEDMQDSEVLKQSQKLEMKFTELGNRMMFFMHFFKELDDENANRIISQSGKYEYFLKEVRHARPYMKSLEEEKIMNLKDVTGEGALSTIRDLVVSSFRFDFQGEEIEEEILSSKVKSNDPEVRKNAYKLLHKKYGDNKKVLGEIYKNLALDWYNEGVIIRGHKSSISVRNFANTLKDETVDMLLSLVRKRRSVFHRYFNIKSKALGHDLSRYHIYAPYELRDAKKYSYEQSQKIVLDVFKGFDKRAYELANNIFEKEHVHSEVLKGKRGGAFCYSYKKDGVPYVMLNHTDDLKSLFTMAHEFGHGIHGQLSKDKTEFTFHAPLPLAETASIFGEMLLMKKMEKDGSLEEKKYILFDHVDGLFASVLRQMYFVIFERDAHDKIKNGCSVDELNTLYMDLLREQFGEDMEISDEFKYEWLRIPHIYESPFYCYAYAFGNLLVLALYNMFEKEGSDFLDKFFNLLGSGGDGEIGTILKEAGIDVDDEAFWSGAFDKIEAEVDKVEKMI